MVLAPSWSRPPVRRLPPGAGGQEVAYVTVRAIRVALGVTS